MTLEVTNAASIEDFAKDRVQTAGDRERAKNDRKCREHLRHYECSSNGRKSPTHNGFLAVGRQYLIVVRDGVDPSTSGFSDRRSTD